MNDPNGLSFVDGIWHAYYQHNPDDDVWGPMHWRHASSVDLVSWTDHGIALAPTELGAIFSGSIVVDHHNTAGFGAGCRVAAFTLATDEAQRQGIAWSDDGHHWTMYPQNPVLVDEAESDFRDPKVSWHDGSWLMSLAIGKRVGFYRSADLKSWQQVGEYVPPQGVSGAIECPDLLSTTTVDGRPAQVLIYGDDRGGRGGHSITMAQPGRFDGSTFEPSGLPAPLDHGPDFYAAQSFHGLAPSQPAVVLGWMSNWRYSNTHPSSGRRGVLSLPRLVRITDDGERVVSHLGVERNTVFPVARAVGRRAKVVNSAPDGAIAVYGGSFSARLRSDVGGAIDVTVGEEGTSLRRDSIGLDDFETSVTLPGEAGTAAAIFDHGTVEVFTDSGRTLSALAFAGSSWTIEVEGDAEIRFTSSSMEGHRQ